MVVYVLGDSSEKRSYYSSCAGENAAYVDNSEIAAAAFSEGGYFYAIGENPFADMTVEGYVAYARALFDNDNMCRKHIRSLLRKTGYNGKISAKMRKLDVFDLRRVQAACKITPATKTLYVNFDGTVYGKKTEKRLAAFVRSMRDYNLHLLVSDAKFVKYPSIVAFADKDGTVNKFPLNTYSVKASVKKMYPLVKDKLKKNEIKAAVKTASFY